MVFGVSFGVVLLITSFDNTKPTIILPDNASKISFELKKSIR
jgi:hypothetical protein